MPNFQLADAVSVQLSEVEVLPTCSGCAAGRYGSGWKAAKRRVDSLQPRPHHSARPATIGGAGLRVLPGCEERV
jgi:hypothetical protein